MSNLLAELEGRVGICPTCGKNTEFCTMKSLEEPDKRAFQWVCWHPAEDGKPKADVLAVLYEVGENKYKFSAAEGFFLLDKTIAVLSAEHEIDLRKHNHGTNFDFGTWWGEFVSHESIENLERYLNTPQDRPIFKTMRQAIVSELELRR